MTRTERPEEAAAREAKLRALELAFNAEDPVDGTDFDCSVLGAIQELRRRWVSTRALAPVPPPAPGPTYGRCRCPDVVVIPFGADHVWTGNLRHSRVQGCYSMPVGAPPPAPSEEPGWRAAIEAAAREASACMTWWPPTDRGAGCLSCGNWTPARNPEAHDHADGCPALAEQRAREDIPARIRALSPPKETP